MLLLFRLAAKACARVEVIDRKILQIASLGVFFNDASHAWKSESYDDVPLCGRVNVYV